MTAFIIHIPLISLLCWRLYRSSYRQVLIPLFWWALTAKLLAGIGIGLLYTYYYPYGGDTFAYFGDAAQLASFARNHPATYLKILFLNDSSAASFLSLLPSWYQPRAFFMVKLVSLLCLLTFNNYWLCSLYLSLLCFYELWRLANVLAAFFPSSARAAGVGFLLLPSVVFWSAGLTKESIAMACIAGIVRLFLLSWHAWLKKDRRLQERQKINDGYFNHADNADSPLAYAGFRPRFSLIASWLILPLYLFLLLQLKYYYLAALLPSLLAFIISDILVKRFFPEKTLLVQLCVLFAVFAGILLASTFLHPNLHIAYFLEALVTNHDLTIQASAPENIIHFTNLQPKVSSVVMHLPEAIFSGIFRPLAGEGNSIFHWFVGIENLLLLALTLYVLFTGRQIVAQLDRSYTLLVAAALLYILLLAALLALSSPNFGALSRYKVAFMPFFTYLLFWAARPESILRGK